MHLTFSTDFFFSKVAEKVVAAANGHKEQLQYEASNTAVDESLPLSAETPVTETASGQEVESAALPAPVRKAVRGRQAKNINAESAAEDKVPKDPEVPALVRGRRGRNAKVAESEDTDVETEKVKTQAAKVALKPKRGRAAKTAAIEPADADQDVKATTNEPVTGPSDETVKPRRGRKPGPSTQNKQKEDPVSLAEDLPPNDQTKGATFCLL